MEEFLPVLFFLLIGIANTISKAKKKQTTTRRMVPPSEAAAPEKPSHPYAPAQPTVMPPMAFSDIPGQVIVPTVHAHIQPDCDTHDQPGSLNTISSEGKDPCHDKQLTHVRTVDEPAEEVPGLTFDWSGASMVKAFVMQEILTRPAARHVR